MKTLIQHRINGSYAGAEGRWVASPGEAAWFPTTADALFYCVNRQLRDVQLRVADSESSNGREGLGLINLPLLDSELQVMSRRPEIERPLP